MSERSEQRQGPARFHSAGAGDTRFTVLDVSASPTFWLTVAAIFGATALLSWAWDAPVLALAQLATAILATVAAWAARRRSAVGLRDESVEHRRHV